MMDGALPVHYITHFYKHRDMRLIFNFLGQGKSSSVNDDVFIALQRHFLFMKDFSKELQTQTDTYYYEREWRLNALSLTENQDPNHCIHEYLKGKTPIHKLGLSKEKGGKIFYSFKPAHVAFLIVPEDWVSRVENPNNFEIIPFEKITNL